MSWSAARANRPQNRRHKTVCDYGHELTPATTYTRKHGQRECKQCCRRRYNEWACRTALAELRRRIGDVVC